MDRVAAAPTKERETLFEDASELLPHLSPALIEKDFWVCWLLMHLFRLNHQVPLIFKGGTSISKAYPIIRRFSEDIDLSLDRKAFGYGDDKLEAATSKKAFRRLVDELRDECRVYVGGPLFEGLKEDIATVLGPSGGAQDWRIEPLNDADSLRFTYPSTAVTLTQGGYVAPNILLEFGARAEHWPAEERIVSSYAAQALPDVFGVHGFPVWTLEVARTFWEKATILHSLANGGTSKVTPRMARHYYDLVMLADSPEASPATQRTDLLDAVADHKARFFPNAWASYATARVGSLRLVPPDDVRRLVEKDYRDMTALFMEEPPSFAVLMERLTRLESSINRPSS